MTDNLEEIAQRALTEFAWDYHVVWLVAEEAWEGASIDHRNKTIKIPKPESPSCLFILLHEVGHIVTGPWRKMTFKEPHDVVLSLRSIYEERDASEWAKQYMEEQGVLVPESIWKRAQCLWERHVKIRQAGPMAWRLGLVEIEDCP